MKPFSLKAYFSEHFSARIFLTFSALIIIISLAFTLFFFRKQSIALTEQAEIKGELLASLLAHNARLGVFTENPDLLGEPIKGLLENRDLHSIAIYTADGKVLLVLNQPDAALSPGAEKWDAGIGRKLGPSTPALHFRNNDDFVFWTRVVLKSPAVDKNDIYANVAPPGESEQTIGFVRIVMDGRPLQKSLNALLLESILIGIAFLMIGSVISYIISGKITKPLNRLTEGVDSFGREGKYQAVSIETNDEIGNLATAFNNMVDSLKKREAENKELEEQLRHSQKMEAIGTMAGGIAHDFNNMLMVINGFSTLLKLEFDEGSRPWSHADQIIAAGEKAAILTQRLLAFTRKQIISPRPINLDENVRNIGKMLARLVTEDIELRFHLDAAERVVMADPGQLDQTLMNLVTNARDAMPNGGVITITTGVVKLDDDFVKRYPQVIREDYLLLTVNDNGVGISDAVREKIFDPFFTTKEVGKGTGLGLSMVYGIVKQHDGIIEVDTDAGKGTSFKIYLPLIEMVLDQQERKMPVLLRGNAETILVAEDDQAVLSFLLGVLQENGYSVVTATNGEDAVQKFIEFQDTVRLVLLDVIMPRKNGREIYDEIIKIRPDIKVLFMSGYTNDVIDWKDARKEGISLLAKPLQADELLEKLREALTG